jgi:hypothetical protein
MGTEKHQDGAKLKGHKDKPKRGSGNRATRGTDRAKLLPVKPTEAPRADGLRDLVGTPLGPRGLGGSYPTGGSDEQRLLEALSGFQQRTRSASSDEGSVYDRRDFHRRAKRLASKVRKVNRGRRLHYKTKAKKAREKYYRYYAQWTERCKRYVKTTRGRYTQWKRCAKKEGIEFRVPFEDYERVSKELEDLGYSPGDLNWTRRHKSKGFQLRNIAIRFKHPRGKLVAVL